MQSLRALCLRHRTLAIFVALAALCLKALMPAGYMIGSDSRVITIEICADASNHLASQSLVIPVKTTRGQTGQGSAANDGACPYGALSMAGLGGVAPQLLAAAIAFILALGFVAVSPPPQSRRPYFTPPLRAPPVRA